MYTNHSGNPYEKLAIFARALVKFLSSECRVVDDVDGSDRPVDTPHEQGVCRDAHHTIHAPELWPCQGGHPVGLDIQMTLAP